MCSIGLLIGQLSWLLKAHKFNYMFMKLFKKSVVQEILLISLFIEQKCFHFINGLAIHTSTLKEPGRFGNAVSFSLNSDLSCREEMSFWALPIRCTYVKVIVMFPVN